MEEDTKIWIIAIVVFIITSLFWIIYGSALIRYDINYQCSRYTEEITKEINFPSLLRPDLKNNNESMLNRFTTDFRYK